MIKQKNKPDIEEIVRISHSNCGKKDKKSEKLKYKVILRARQRDFAGGGGRKWFALSPKIEKKMLSTCNTETWKNWVGARSGRRKHRC